MRAGNGEIGCRRLDLSLHRLAAIQILERFRELFMESAGEGMRAMGCAVAPFTSQEGGTAEQIGRAAADKWRTKAQGRPANITVQSIWAALRSLLQQSSVLTLAAGEVVHLSASAVLVRGAVDASKPSQGKGHHKGESSVRQVALSPCVLVWPEFKPAASDKAAKVPLRAGAFS